MACLIVPKHQRWDNDAEHDTQVCEHDAGCVWVDLVRRLEVEQHEARCKLADGRHNFRKFSLQAGRPSTIALKLQSSYILPSTVHCTSI